MNTNDSSVNYIKHLTKVFEKIAIDDRLTASHVSLYMAIFQLWNVNRFVNPLLIIRSELMQISKISSKSTYHRCINDLDAFGYLEYFPSKNPLTGSKIKMVSDDQLIVGHPFENESAISEDNSSKYGHLNGIDSPKYGHINGTDSSKCGHLNEPFYKHINI